MASMKAKKGNPFEKDVMYSLQQGGYKVKRFDDNKAGIDLVATKEGYNTHVIECKNRQGLTWNSLVKIYEKSKKSADNLYSCAEVCVVFHSKYQPVLVFYEENTWFHVSEFNFILGCEFKKRPKGFRFK